MKTPFISLRSFEELWEIGAGVPGLSIALGKQRGGGEPRGVLEAPVELAVGGEHTVPAFYSQTGLASTIIQLSSHPPLAQPSQQWPSPPNCPLPTALLPPQHCPTVNQRHLQ